MPTITHFRDSPTFGPVQQIKCDSEAEWLDVRRQDLTASDIGAVIGHNPFKTPAEIKQEKLHGNRQPVNAFMKYGMDNEDVAARLLASRINGHIFPVTFYLRAPHHRLGASLDRIVSVTDGPNVPLEIKTTGQNTFERYWRGSPPEYVKAQLMLQCGLLGDCEFGFIGVMIRETRAVHVFKCRFNQASFLHACKGAAQFWAEIKR